MYKVFELSGPDTFYELREDPILVYDVKKNIQVNSQFITTFSNGFKNDLSKPYSRILSDVEKIADIEVKFYDINGEKHLNLSELIQDAYQYNNVELGITIKAEQKIFILNVYKHAYIDNESTVMMFKDVTKAHRYEKEKSENKFKTVLMG